jgi:hypothetical protein
LRQGQGLELQGQGQGQGHKKCNRQGQGQGLELQGQGQDMPHDPATHQMLQQQNTEYKKTENNSVQKLKPFILHTVAREQSCKNFKLII